MRQYLATGRGRVVVAVLLLGVVVVALAVARRPGGSDETSYLQAQTEAADSAAPRGPAGRVRRERRERRERPVLGSRPSES